MNVAIFLYERRRRTAVAVLDVSLNDIEATGSIVFSAAADLDAVGELVSVGALLFGSAADLTGTVNDLVATGNIVFSEAADLDATGNLVAAATVTFGQAADLDATGTLQATATVVFGSSAALTGATNNDLVATGTITFGQSAVLNAPGNMAALGAIVFSGSAAFVVFAVQGQEEYTTLWEFVLESDGAELLRLSKSFEGIRTPAIDFEQGMLSMGRIIRQIGPGSEPYNIGLLHTELHNTDRQFSTLKNGYRFRGRKQYVRFGRISDGLAQARQLFVGSVEDWDLQNAKVRFSLRDTAIDRFKKPLRSAVGSITSATFGDLPGGRPEVLINVIYGDISTNGGNMTGAGPIPCHRIDENAAGKWRYLVAGHVCQFVDSVFVYGIVQTTGFFVTTAVYGGKTMQVIDFDADPRNPARPNEVEVTCLAIGITENGLQSGVLIENPVKQLKHFLLNYAGWNINELDTALFDAAAAAADANMLNGVSAPYKGSMFIGGDVNRRVLDVLNEMTRSFLLYTWMTTADKVGTFLLTLTEASNPGAAAVKVVDGKEILRNSFRVYGNRDVYSGIDFQRVYNWTLARYAVTVEDSVSVDVLRNFPLPHTSRVLPLAHSSRSFPLHYDAGASATLMLGDEDTPNVPEKLVSLEYVADEDTAISVASTYGLLAHEQVQFCEFGLPAEFLLNSGTDLNRYVSVTHWQGPSGDGLGYVEETFRVVRWEAALEPKQKTLKCTGIKIVG